MVECPRCGAYIKDDPAECPYCGRNLRGAPQADSAELQQRKDELARNLSPLLSYVPLLSLQIPLGWDYRPLTLVTAQSVTGTGLFADVGSIFTDAFGLQSGMFRNKLLKGEQLCKSSLRLDALKVGGHAVIGVDVDYADVGNAKSMLMVCMTGTAISLNDLSVLHPKTCENIEKASAIAAEIRSIGM